jgi:hypothetical protein
LDRAPSRFLRHLGLIGLRDARGASLGLRRGEVGAVAEGLARRFQGREGILRALGDLLALVLRDGCEDADRELVGVRVVAAHEVDPGFEQVVDEGGRPREAASATRAAWAQRRAGRAAALKDCP